MDHYEEERERKTIICQELDSAIKAAVAEYSRDGVVSGDTTQEICNIIEAVFIHGLKDAFFVKNSRYSKYPEPNFWPLVSKFTQKEVKGQIASFKQIKNEIGKARAWIRIVLNEGAFENYISLLSKDQKQLNVFYTRSAFLRDIEKVEALIGYTKALTRIKINAATNSTFLNSWTPSPLTLAGMIVAERASKAQHCRKPDNRSTSFNSLEDDEPEVALNAVDLLNDTSSDTLPSISMDDSSLFAQSPNPITGDEDERSSVYSHPSMLDGFGTVPFRPSFVALLSSSPENTAVFTPTIPFHPHPNHRSSSASFFPHEEQSAEVIVHRRRVARIRRNSKSSSEDDRDKSRSSSSGAGASRTESRVLSDEGQAEAHEKLLSVIAPEQVSSNGEGEVHTAEVSASGIEQASGEDVRLFENASEPEPIETKEIRSETGDDNSQQQTYEIASPILQRRVHEQIHEQSEEIFSSLQDELKISDPFNEDAATAHEISARGHEVKAYSHSPREQYEELACSSSSLSTDYSGPMMSLDSALQGAFKAQAPLESSSSEIHPSEEPSEYEEAVEGNKTPTKCEGAELLPRETGEKQHKEPELESKTDLLYRIVVEKGLDKQEFRCPSCRKSIGGTSFNSWRLCHFDGQLYCENCLRKGEETLIPARMVLNWDIRPREVSKASKAFLKSVTNQPLFRIDQLNSRLYEHSHQMKRLEQLRRKLSLVVMYLLNCKSVAEDMKKRIWPHDHWYSDIHLYSLEDLENVLSGAMEKKLNSMITHAVNHVNACPLCLQKGFVCELCASKRVIYPFQTELVERCKVCYAVYHRECIGKQDGRCPKCLRRRKHSSSANLSIRSPSLQSSSQCATSPLPNFSLPLPSV